MLTKAIMILVIGTLALLLLSAQTSHSAPGDCIPVPTETAQNGGAYFASPLATPAPQRLWLPLVRVS